MKRFFCPFLNQDVELSCEREEHVRTYHPDIEPFMERLGEVLEDPDEIRKSLHDEEVILFYRRLKSIPEKFLVTVVKRRHRSFMLTAYLTPKIKEGERLWKKA